MGLEDAQFVRNMAAKLEAEEAVASAIEKRKEQANIKTATGNAGKFITNSMHMKTAGALTLVVGRLKRQMQANRDKKKNRDKNIVPYIIVIYIGACPDSFVVKGVATDLFLIITNTKV